MNRGKNSHTRHPTLLVQTNNQPTEEMISRRSFTTSSLKAGALTVAATLPGLRSLAQNAVSPPVRKSIGELDLDDPIVETYRKFVGIMKGRPDTDAVTWSKMSDIHGTDAGFNRCPHGSWYFLPWHRAYLSMYEQICREETGTPDFAMPYWDWTADRQLPAAFADETWNGNPNPLFEPSRWWAPTDPCRTTW